jgi:Zn-finger nucleic acid-binding protein
MTLGFIGTGNPSGNDPSEKAERMLSQNLVYACKGKAKTAKELSEELCVPMAFIEEELAIQVKGENGSYGLLRKESDKYIANVLVVDEDEFNQANGIYNKYADVLCARLKQYLNENRDRFLDFPYLSEQTDLRFILWTLISESVWFTRGKVADILESKYFQNVKHRYPDFQYTRYACYHILYFPRKNADIRQFQLQALIEDNKNQQYNYRLFAVCEILVFCL